MGRQVIRLGGGAPEGVGGRWKERSRSNFRRELFILSIASISEGVGGRGFENSDTELLLLEPDAESDLMKTGTGTGEASFIVNVGASGGGRRVT